jgi:hypothetical protein
VRRVERLCGPLECLELELPARQRRRHVPGARTSRGRQHPGCARRAQSRVRDPSVRSASRCARSTHAVRSRSLPAAPSVPPTGCWYRPADARPPHAIRCSVALRCDRASTPARRRDARSRLQAPAR